MKSAQLTMLCIVVIFFNATAQMPPFAWALHSGGTGIDGGLAVQPDGLGHVYTAGHFRGLGEFGNGVQMTATATDDYYLAQYDTTGHCNWALHFPYRNFPGYTTHGSAFLASDASGVYMVGELRGTVDFDPGPATANLTSNYNIDGLFDIFIAKYDLAGHYLWAKHMGGDYKNYASGVAVNNTGVYISGSFGGSVDFDPGAGTAILQPADVDMFIAKYDLNGNYLWSKCPGTFRQEGSNFFAGTANGMGMALSNTGLYVTGNYQGTIDFDPGAALAEQNNPVLGATDAFVARYDLNGNYVWAKSLHGLTAQASAEGHQLMLNNDALYLTGTYADQVDFNPGAGIAKLVTDAEGLNSYSFMAKYDLNGGYLWANSFNDKKGGQELTFASDGNGLLLAGAFDQEIDVDPSAATTFLTPLNTAYGDFYLAKYKPDGSYDWSKIIPNTLAAGTHYPAAMAAVNSGLFITGTFYNVINFDPAGGSADAILTSKSDDAFLVKYKSTFTQAPASPFTDTTVFVSCGTDLFNLTTLYNQPGYNLSWSTASPAAADTGIYTLTATKGGFTYTSKVNVSQDVETWLGTADSNWHNPANWSKGRVPTALTHVRVPATPTAYSPAISNANAVAASVVTAAQSELHVNGLRKLNITSNCSNLPGEPLVSAKGKPLSDTTSATIGAAGGTICRPDGSFCITVPAGGVAANTIFSIIPISNNAPEGVGQAYRLLPEDKQFAKPVTLTFNYNHANYANPEPDFLWVVSHNSDGTWAGYARKEDTIAKTISIPVSHFSDWAVSRFMFFYLYAERALLKPGESADLFIKGTKFYNDENFSNIENTQPEPIQQAISLTDFVNDSKVRWMVGNWYLNGFPAPVSSNRGILNYATGLRKNTFFAPSQVPAANPQRVDVQMKTSNPYFKKGLYLVTGKITVDDYYLRLNEGAFHRLECGQIPNFTYSTDNGTSYAEMQISGNDFQLIGHSSYGLGFSFGQKGVNGVGTYSHTKASNDGVNHVLLKYSYNDEQYDNIYNEERIKAGDECNITQRTVDTQLLTITKWGISKGQVIEGFIFGTYYYNQITECESSIPHQYQVEFRLIRQ